MVEGTWSLALHRCTNALVHLSRTPIPTGRVNRPQPTAARSHASLTTGRAQQQAVRDLTAGRRAHPAGVRLLLLVRGGRGALGAAAARRRPHPAYGGQLRAVLADRRRRLCVRDPPRDDGCQVQVREAGHCPRARSDGVRTWPDRQTLALGGAQVVKMASADESSCASFQLFLLIFTEIR